MNLEEFSHRKQSFIHLLLTLVHFTFPQFVSQSFVTGSVMLVLKSEISAIKFFEQIIIQQPANNMTSRIAAQLNLHISHIASHLIK